MTLKYTPYLPPLDVTQVQLSPRPDTAKKPKKSLIKQRFDSSLQLDPYQGKPLTSQKQPRRLQPLIGLSGAAARVKKMQRMLLAPVSVSKDEEIDPPEKEFSDLILFPNKNYRWTMPEGTLLSDQDLIIFANSYPGVLPYNGIRHRDFKNLLKLWEDIQNNRGIFDIKVRKSDVSFVKDLFRQLLLSRSGRALFVKLMEQNKPIEVRETKGNDEFEIIDRKRVVRLQLKHPPGVIVCYVGLKPDGTHELVKITPLWALYHELVHALLNKSTEIKLPSELEETWDLPWEMETIIGIPLTQYQFMRDTLNAKPDPETDDAAWKKIQEQNLLKLETYFRVVNRKITNLISTFENMFNMEHGLLPRDSHVGIDKPVQLKITTDEVHEDLQEYLFWISLDGCEKDLREFFQLNPDIITKSYNGELALYNIIRRLVKEGRTESIRILLFTEYSTLGSSQVLYAMQTAAKQGRLEVLKSLLLQPERGKIILMLPKETPLLERTRLLDERYNLLRKFHQYCTKQLFYRDTHLNNLLHFAVSIKEETAVTAMITFLMSQGLLQMHKNLDGITPLDLSIENNNTFAAAFFLPNIKPESYREAFEKALHVGHPDMIQLFLHLLPSEDTLPKDEYSLSRLALLACKYLNHQSIVQVFKILDQFASHLYLAAKADSGQSLGDQLFPNKALRPSERHQLMQFLRRKGITFNTFGRVTTV